MVDLAPHLLGPVGLELAKAVEQLPGPEGMPGRFPFRVEAGRVPSLNLVKLQGRPGAAAPPR